MNNSIRLPNLYMILATDRHGGIGYQNKLPWRIPAEMKYFRETTDGSAVIMGRATFESIGKALKNRYNIVITSDPLWSAQDVDVVHSLEEALKLVKELEFDTFVIGGKQVYEQFAPYVSKVYLTLVAGEYKTDTAVELKDAFGAPWDYGNSNWTTTSSNSYTNEDGSWSFTTYIYTANNHGD